MSIERRWEMNIRKLCVITVCLLTVFSVYADEKDTAQPSAEKDRFVPTQQPRDKERPSGFDSRDSMAGDAMIMRLITNPRIAEQIGLSEEQCEKIKEETFTLKREQIKIKADLDLAGLDQAQLMTQKEIDEKAIMKAVERVGELNTELAKIKTKQILMIKNNLTEEQVAKIHEMMAKRIQKFSDRDSDKKKSPELSDRRPPREDGDAPLERKNFVEDSEEDED